MKTSGEELLGLVRGSDDREGAGGSLGAALLRLVPEWLRRPPERVAEADRKVYAVRAFIAGLSMVVHSGLIVLYLVLQEPILALVNLVAVLIHTAVFLLIRRGAVHGPVVVSLVEIGVHLTIHNWVVGLSGGYLFYMPLVAMSGFLLYRPEEPVGRYGVTLFALLSTPVVIFLTRDISPWIALERWKLDTLLYLNGGCAFLALLCFTYYFSALTDRAERLLGEELGRSEQLLLNILPAPIAARLKRSSGTIADGFPEVTVLFADIVGFTSLAARSSSAEIVDMLNRVFSAFDQIADRMGLEKIKTIGDAYMVVGGIPTPLEDHAAVIARMALEMQEAIAECSPPGTSPLRIRVGIHTGPVVAGVIGLKKFSYDLWGDTVNTASRMESQGIPGRIQVSEQTYSLLKGRFLLEPRGLIPVKGKGEARTWLLLGEHPSEIGRALDRQTI